MPVGSNPWSDPMTTHKFEVFFDGECPLCRREIDFLARRDGTGRIRFTDIASSRFDPSDYGMTQADFMLQIRGRLADGTMIRGVEVFRRLYSEVGFRWLVALTRVAPLSFILEAAYWLFAKNRLRLTGRCSNDACALPDTRAL